jgi:hypothetical protein
MSQVFSTCINEKIRSKVLQKYSIPREEENTQQGENILNSMLSAGQKLNSWTCVSPPQKGTVCIKQKCTRPI